MIAYQKERKENAICFFADEFRKTARKNLPSMGLYKLLAFMDHWGVKNTGKPVFDFTYKAMQMGPVPMELYGQRSTIKSSLFSFLSKGEERFDVVSKGSPDLDFFSDKELGEMERLVAIFGDKSMTTLLMSEASHKDITAWNRTFRQKPNAVIDFGLTFLGDIYSKNEEKLTPEEDRFLLFLGFKRFHEARNSS